jgi:TonB family protein
MNRNISIASRIRSFLLTLLLRRNRLLGAMNLGCIKVLSMALLFCPLAVGQSADSLPAGTRLRVQMQNTVDPPISPLAIASTNLSQVGETISQSPPRDMPKTSARLGDLLITLNEVENPAAHPRNGNREDRHEVLIKGIVKNIGKNPVCASITSKLETSFRLEESVTITLAKQDWGTIRELLPSEQLDASFAASVKNGTDPLKLTISQSQPEQGCGDNSHHLYFNTDVTIPVTSLPLATMSWLGTGEGGGVLQVGGSVSPPRVVQKTEPDFPEETRKAKHQGTVIIRAIVGTDGRVHDARVVRSLGWGLDEKALGAVSQWVFNPATKDGRKVPVYVDVEVNFRLY